MVIRPAAKRTEEELYLPTAISEKEEMYAKAVWLAKEKGESPVSIPTLSRMLKAPNSSIIQMVRKLQDWGYVKYLSGKGVELTQEGLQIGQRMVRNSRLVEVLMNVTGFQVDERIACGIEHHMSEDFTDALCHLLGHMRRCPHGNLIPSGRCCPKI